MRENISDFYIKGNNDPGFINNQIEATSFIDTVISKIYIILLTNKGDVLSDPHFGADITMYLWKTKFPASTIVDNIKSQFSKYIPELSASDYLINVYIIPGTGEDIGIVNINLGIANVNFLYK